jgi:hypothetical protein
VKTSGTVVLKVLAGLYFLLTSVYCLLAFLPYTYCALIKAPAYEWMPWFVRHHASLYWVALLAAAAAHWPAEKSQLRNGLLVVLAAVGIGLTLRPFMATVQNNQSAYVWSLAALLPVIVVSALDLKRFAAAPEEDGYSLLNYTNAIVAAIVVALVYAAGEKLSGYLESKTPGLSAADLQLTIWSLVSHAVIASVALSILNLIRIAASRTKRPRMVTWLLLGGLIFACLWIATARFLQDALSFEGWQAWLYAVSLAAALVLLGFSVVSSFRTRAVESSTATKSGKILIAGFGAAMILAALALPTLIRGGDWNGLLQRLFALALWVSLSLCIYALRPRRGMYAVSTIVGVLFLTGATYKALQASEIFWAKALGGTDDDISRSLEAYGLRDASFQLAHNLLGNSRSYPCGDLCRIMRQHTDIRDTEAKVDVNLVEKLSRTSMDRPNIFIFVIDSLRPDYLGAYNKGRLHPEPGQVRRRQRCHP